MEKIIIYTRGASKGNPGPAAIGVYVEDINGNEILKVSESIGNATTEYAEYFSVVRAFQALKEKYGEETVNIEFELRQENELVDSHLKAQKQINDVSLIGHFIEIYNLRVSHFHNLTIIKINREENKEADRLVDESLDVR